VVEGKLLPWECKRQGREALVSTERNINLLGTRSREASSVPYDVVGDHVRAPILAGAGPKASLFWKGTPKPRCIVYQNLQ
jgi:hypothetical protein